MCALLNMQCAFVYVCVHKDPCELVIPFHINRLKMNEPISMKMELFGNGKERERERNKLHATHFSN